jgi:polar amino acid transport system substrate-binding protein
VGIAIAQAGSAFYAARDKATGKPRGVTVDLSRELADSLGVPLDLVALL